MASSSIPFYLLNIPNPLPPPSSPIRESVADIVARAYRKIALNWNRSISLSVLLRSYEKTVLYQGAVYVSEGDYVQGYLYLYMFAEFAISWIKQHPDRARPQYKHAIQHVQDLCSTVVLRVLGELRPLINDSHEKYLEQQARIAKKRERIRKASPAPPATLKAETDKQRRRQLDETRPIPDTTRNGASEEPWDLLKQMEGIKFVSGRPQVQDIPAPRVKMELRYPTIAQQQLPRPDSSSTQAYFQPPLQSPSLPPKTPSIEASVQEIVSSGESAAPHPPPSPPRPQESETRQFMIGSYLENGQDLRSVFIPSTLRERFLKIAEPNTQRNLETCGILCGVLRNNAFIICCLLIPPQTATSDSCTTTDEEALFEFQDKHNLFTLGWIHTHPTQTCFMSSVDLHTHLGYQILLAEAIAIVCAPSKQPRYSECPVSDRLPRFLASCHESWADGSWGVFRLTDPPGVKTITDCQQKSLFHPHPIPGEDIYRDCWRESSDGHVREMPGAKLEVVDLRK